MHDHQSDHVRLNGKYPIFSSTQYWGNSKILVIYNKWLSPIKLQRKRSELVVWAEILVVQRAWLVQVRNVTSYGCFWNAFLAVFGLFLLVCLSFGMYFLFVLQMCIAICYLWRKDTVKYIAKPEPSKMSQNWNCLVSLPGVARVLERPTKRGVRWIISIISLQEVSFIMDTVKLVFSAAKSNIHCLIFSILK